MTNFLIRRHRRITRYRDISRSELRQLLKNAASGDRQAYLALVEPYFDLVLENLYFAGFTAQPDRLARANQIFHQVWQRIAFTTRVSDFERLLYHALCHLPAQEGTFLDTLPRQLSRLSPRDRFLLVAREMEDWHPRWLVLCCRTPRPQLNRSLLYTRNRLTGFPKHSLSRSDNAVLRELSRSLDEVWQESHLKMLRQHLQERPALREWKSLWLEKRCELIELRQDLRLPEEVRNPVLAALLQSIRESSPLQPNPIHHLLNAVRFQAYPRFSLS